MVNDIKMLLSNIDIIDISHNNITHKDENIYRIINNTRHIEIFILMRELRTTKIMNIVQKIKSHNDIPTNKIQIISILTYQNILNRLSHDYPQLKIYTTEITCD